MRLAEPQHILIDGARRQEHAAARNRKRRLARRRALVVGLLLIGGAAAPVVITLSRSGPLSATVAQGPSLRGASHYRISAFPYMTVGWSGWCTSAVFDSRSGREVADYGCGAVESGGPVIAGGGGLRGFFRWRASGAVGVVGLA